MRFKFYGVKHNWLIKVVFFLAFVVILLLDGCKNHEVARIEKRPNILFILVDDLGLHDLGVTGSAFYETPHIDRIAKEGTVFTQGYASSRVCSPSRASIMLGQATARHGITDWIGAKSGEDWRSHNRNDKLLPAEYSHVLPSRDTTLAEALADEGYTNFFSGKWHLGKEGSWPIDHGFHFNEGGWDKGSPIGGYFSPWKNPNLENRDMGENLSLRLAKETANFMEQYKDSSFFAFLSFYAVHGPIQTTQEKWRKYRDKANQMGILDSGYEMERVLPIRVVQDNPVYAGLVEQMDDAVGIVLDKLEELGLEDNTIIVFTSDNGGVASGDAFSSSNLPLRGGKGYQWEGGIREPYFIKVPWLQAHKTIDYPVTGADFYPTIIDLVGIDIKPEQHLDGISLMPLLKGEDLPERSLYWHYPHYGNQGGEPSSIIRKGKWKLIHYWEDGRNELYHLNKDIGEQKDVAKENPVKTSELLAELMAYLDRLNAQRPKPDPEYDPELALQKQREKREVLLPRLEEERKRFLSQDYEPNDDWWGSRVTLD